MHTHSVILQNELTRRLAKNPSYSLRAFAKSLGLSPSALSEIISGKRGISLKKGSDLLSRMELPEQEEREFIDSIKSTKKSKTSKKLDSLDSDYKQLTLDSLKVVCDWYHFAILNLAKIKGAKSDFKWIASKLSISQIEAKLALERLSRLELIETKNGFLKRTEAQLKTTDGVPSKYIRKLQRDLLEKAIASLDQVEVERRDITSMVMAIDPKDMEKAKEDIKEFRRKFSNQFEAGLKKEVYSLTISLIPLSEVNL